VKQNRRTKTKPLPEKVLLRVDEVAQYFDVTPRTVYLWIDHGHLEIEYTPGSQIRVTKDSIDKCRFNRKNKK
jgi:excisionase family DNA binding protein